MNINKLFAFVVLLFVYCVVNENKSKWGDYRKDNKGYLKGIDVSHYNGRIDWDTVKKSNQIDFVVLRATMGDDRKDKKYKQNIKEARNRGYLVGSYHYFDPDEDGLKQANNFIQTIECQKGDIRPIIDIEKLSKTRSRSELVGEVKKCLQVVERRFGVRPIIYSGLVFYKDYLERDLNDYPLWIAAYSPHRKDEVFEISSFHQYSETEKFRGIYGNKGNVDANLIMQKDLPHLLVY